MKKFVYFIFSVFFLAQGAAATSDCDRHINNYFNKNYSYSGGTSAAVELAAQRRCLHARNPIYSDAYEFEQKQRNLLSIDGDFIVRKNLIDYQEAAEILAQNNDVQRSSEYVDKFNTILIEHYDKISAAKILKDQVEKHFISRAHQEELFAKLDEYLPNMGVCHPGICEGYGLISVVAGLFPRCAEDSCQKNITYENLYFDLAKNTNNLQKATETIQNLLAKDFGSSRSNGEVKAPLIMALYYSDLDAFSAQAKNFLDEASRTIRYTYQDAILLPLITQMMIVSGQVEDLLPYTQTRYNNIAGLEATLALLSVPLEDTIRQRLRSDLETYYELTSACDEYRIENYQGTSVIRQGTPALLTRDPELDLYLRQYMQSAYWIDGFGGFLDNQATENSCVPPLDTPEEIDPVFASAQVARDFVREGFIDDVVLLPLFAFSKIKAVFQGIRKSEQALKVIRYNDRALEVAENTRRIELGIERSLERQIPREIPYRIAAGQDFMPSIGDGIRERRLFEIIDGKSWRGGSPERRAAERRITYGNGRHPEGRDIDFEEVLLGEPKKTSNMNKTLAKQKKRFNRNAKAQMRHIGFEKSNKLAKELRMEWQELERFMTDPELSELLAKADSRRTDQIFQRIKNLYNKYYAQITNNSGHNFIFAYVTRYNARGVDISNIHLVEEVTERNEYLKYFFKYGTERKPVFLSNSWQFSPKNPKQTLNMYTELLGCTSAKPCYALFSENRSILRLYSNDQSKIIRVAPHEYSISENSIGLHFHYYEIGGDFSINHRFILDATDPFNDFLSRDALYLQDLLLPEDAIKNSDMIRVSYR